LLSGQHFVLHCLFILTFFGGPIIGPVLSKHALSSILAINAAFDDAIAVISGPL
jgi:hypothetical protein